MIHEAYNYVLFQVKSYESINSLSSERKRSGGAATPRSIDEEVTSTTPDLVEGTDDKSAPISLESIPAAVPTSEDEPYYDQVPVDINDGEYVYIQAGLNYDVVHLMVALVIYWSISQNNNLILTTYIHTFVLWFEVCSFHHAILLLSCFSSLI